MAQPKRRLITLSGPRTVSPDEKRVRFGSTDGKVDAILYVRYTPDGNLLVDVEAREGHVNVAFSTYGSASIAKR